MSVCVSICTYKVVDICPFSPAFLWSWALTVSFAESPDSAIIGWAQSGWTDIAQALKMKVTAVNTRSCALRARFIRHKKRSGLIYSWNQIFLCVQKENATYPLHTCPFPLIPATKPPPYSDHYCRRQAGCCYRCYRGPQAAMESCLSWPADGWDLVVFLNYTVKLILLKLQLFWWRWRCNTRIGCDYNWIHYWYICKSWIESATDKVTWLTRKNLHKP